MKLYGHPMSNHALRVKALIEEFNLPYEMQVVDFEKQDTRTPEFLKLNPNGKVPVLVDNDFVLWESHAIMRYLCDKHERYDWYPKHLKERALVDQWLDWCNTRLNPEAVTIAINTFFNTGADDKIEAAKSSLSHILPIIEAIFEKQDWLCGNKITIADLSLLSSLMYLNMCGGVLEKYPATLKWYEENFANSPMAKVMPATK